MLKWMHLENLALVEKADMEFGSGFNVISGETGARPIKRSNGAPMTMAKLLPVSRLFAAGVSNPGSISRNNSAPELIVPVSMPYMNLPH